MRSPDDAVSGGASMALIAPGALIAGAFWAIAWLEPRPGQPIFMVAIGVADADPRVRVPARSVVVVDNGSTDATAALATRAGARVITAPQRGR